MISLRNFPLDSISVINSLRHMNKLLGTYLLCGHNFLLSFVGVEVTGVELGFSELALLEALGSILPLTGVLRITELKNIELGVELVNINFEFHAKTKKISIAI